MKKATKKRFLKLADLAKRADKARAKFRSVDADLESTMERSRKTIARVHTSRKKS